MTALNTARLRELLAAHGEALAAYSYRNVMSRGMLADARAELGEAAFEALPELLAIAEAAERIVEEGACSCRTGSGGSPMTCPVCVEILQLERLLDAARKAGT